VSGESPTDLARRLGMKVPQLRRQLHTLIRRILDRHNRAAQLFLDDDGNLKPAAREWFAELARDNFVNRSAFHEDPREHAKREGRRELALEIISSAHLDVERLGSLTRLEREME
jgi:hypothetical protein